MPEPPEIAILARQMDEALSGAEVKKPKCLNRPVAEFTALVWREPATKVKI